MRVYELAGGVPDKLLVDGFPAAGRGKSEYFHVSVSP